MPRPIERLLTMVCKTPSYLAMKMARITITKNGYRDNVAHALSLGRVDQGGLLDLMLLFLTGWSASAPWDSLLVLVLVRRRVPLASVVGSRVSCACSGRWL